MLGRELMIATQRFRCAAVIIMALYAALVAGHHGEFWPFSIFPMFSRAGRPWTRATVRDVGNDVGCVRWSATTERHLPGRPFPLAEAGIDQNDLSELVASAGEHLDAERRAVLDHWFQGPRKHRQLAIYSVRGSLDGERRVQLLYTPVAIVGPRGTFDVVSGTP
jgi:hypothetical protein